LPIAASTTFDRKSSPAQSGLALSVVSAESDEGAARAVTRGRATRDAGRETGRETRALAVIIIVAVD
jgi:hypothetical protein